MSGNPYEMLNSSKICLRKIIFNIEEYVKTDFNRIHILAFLHFKNFRLQDMSKAYLNNKTQRIRWYISKL